MKHVLFTLICLATLLVSCSDNNDDPETITISKDQLNQTVYADNTEKGITFTATEAWHTEVDYSGTKATNAGGQWVTLDPPSGGAGEVTIKVTLAVNRTGADRFAKVRIVCGGTTITIVIEQKGETEEGKIPDAGTYDKLVSKIEIANTNYLINTTSYSEWLFTYDAQNRITSYKENDIEDGKHIMDWSDEYTYSGNTITCLEKVDDNGKIIEYRSTYTLNEEGNVSEWEEEYNETGKPEVNKGTITYTDGYFSSSASAVSGRDPDSDSAVWENGNLVKAADSDPKYFSTMEYGKTRNAYNIDFNYLLASSEWLDCLGFGMQGIKPFGYFGKRSANLMTKETDSENNHYSVFEYRTDAEGYIDQIVITGHESNGDIESRRVLSVSYTDAK